MPLKHLMVLLLSTLILLLCLLSFSSSNSKRSRWGSRSGLGVGGGRLELVSLLLAYDVVFTHLYAIAVLPFHQLVSISP